MRRAAGRALELVREARRSGVSAAELADRLGIRPKAAAVHLRELERLGSVRHVRVRVLGRMTTLYFPAG